MNLKTFRLLSVLSLGLALGVVSCNKDSDPLVLEPQFGKEYFPTRTGMYWDYRVDSAYFNTVNGSDTLYATYYLREVVGPVLVQNLQDTTYRLDRYIKTDLSAPWPNAPERVYSLTALPEGVLRVEENVPTLALRYPFRIGSTWNGNQYNALSSLEITFRAESFKPFTVITALTDSVLTVVERADSNCLEKADVYTKYARSIGPVVRFRNIFEYVQNPVNPCGDTAVVRRVNRYSQKLIGYGTL